MPAPDDSIDGLPASDDSPIEELQALLEASGEEIAKLFGPALTIFAGASAGTKDEKQKFAELERIIVGQ
jgi:hypothetical protein